MKALTTQVLGELNAQVRSLKAFNRDEVAKHASADDAWIVIDGLVYNVTKFAKLHPGGTEVLLRHAGKDATEDFKLMHHHTVLQKDMYRRLCIGRVDMSPSETKALVRVKVQERWLPFTEPYWVDPRGTFRSPYYNDKHRSFQLKVRAFVEEHIKPFGHKWDEAGTCPDDLAQRAYAAGVFGAPWPKEYGGTPPEGWDMFMDLILLSEIGRGASGGTLASFFLATNIALPPVLNHGSKMLKDKVARDAITGKTTLALAVTEPWGGSDVARIRCTAVRDGDHFIVNGEKKFITAGSKAAYLTTAVRTDPNAQGMEGVSLLLIDAKLPGVTIVRQKTMGWWCSSTTYITFENVRVPADHVIGQLNNGFRYIMENFNHERFAGIVFAIAGCRVCIEESIRFARVRKTFGKRLIDSQVIRQKIGHMAIQTEALHALSEQIAFQMQNNVPHTDVGPLLAGTKVLVTKHLEFCAREACQILGGNSFVRGGHGERIERLYREVRVAAIGGGSEEVMMDLAMRGSKL
eukprot:PhM_4_TR11326/c1_g1_i1/m.51687